jgi:predicted GTPase
VRGSATSEPPAVCCPDVYEGSARAGARGFSSEGANDVLRNWRAWTLIVLFFGPVAVYVGFGALWLAERTGPFGVRAGWLYIATSLWIVAGIAFAIYANRWTKAQRELLPPIDWDAPHTFSPFDRQAWLLVQEEADRGDVVSIEELSNFDIYVSTGRKLAQRLAAHYHPLSTDPIEHVPIVEILTALELAAEDLCALCREVPGGDMVTAAHWKKAVQAAGYLQKASDLYTYLLPIFQPVTGLVRLGTQKLMVQPAWKNMQQNVMRWFFRAYVNRLGTHLIELYSGRLAIGVERYRHLTRRKVKTAPIDEAPRALRVGLVGMKDAGKTLLIEALQDAQTGGLEKVRGRLVAEGLDEDLSFCLQEAQWIEVPSYTAAPGQESARDRATRREAVATASECDLLLVVHDMSRDEVAPDAKFLEAWTNWYTEHPVVEQPPILGVVTGADRPAFGLDWRPPYDWRHGRNDREVAVRARVDALRAALGPKVGDVVAVGLVDAPPYGVNELLLPAIAPYLPRAERVALIRHLRETSARSKASRLFTQVGRQSRRLFDTLKNVRGQRRPVG